MTHTEKAHYYLTLATNAVRKSAKATAEERKDLLVEASNYALLASQELAVEHSVVCLPE
jgi:hypothetical protein